MTVNHIGSIDETTVKNCTGVTRKVLVAMSEAPNFEMRLFSIQPGGKIPTHTNEVEHEQYVLNGRGQIGIGEERFEVEKGSVLFIPAKTPHWYKNIGDEPFEFLCMVPNQPDTMKML